VAVGGQALSANQPTGTTNGLGNTAVGYNALNVNTTGRYNTAIGYNANISSGSFSNSTAIGYNASATASDNIVIGGTAVTAVYYYGVLAACSDGRFKTDVKEDVQGLAFIKQLRPVTYHLDMHGLDKFLYGDGAVEYEKQMAEGIAAKEKIVYSGFIAQEVEQAAKKTGYDFSGVVHPKNEKDHYKIDYSEFVVPLVKAVQEQQQMIDSLKLVSGQRKSVINGRQLAVYKLKFRVTNQRMQILKSRTLQSMQNSNHSRQILKKYNNGYTWEQRSKKLQVIRHKLQVVS
jgi:hypothetical protein